MRKWLFKAEAVRHIHPAEAGRGWRPPNVPETLQDCRRYPQSTFPRWRKIWDLKFYNTNNRYIYIYVYISFIWFCEVCALIARFICKTQKIVEWSLMICISLFVISLKEKKNISSTLFNIIYEYLLQGLWIVQRSIMYTATIDNVHFFFT